MIKLFSCTIFLTLFLFHPVFSQVKKKNFVLTGNIRGIPDGKTIHLTTGYVSFKAADWKLKSDSATIFNGEFIFKGKLSYPHGVRINFDDSDTHFQSGLFFIEKGKQHTDIDISSQNGKTPIVKGSYTNELFIKNYHTREIEKEYLGLIEKAQSLYRNYKNNIPESEKTIFFREREEYHLRKDSFLIKDTKINRSYFISLWLATENLQSYGYKPLYYEVFNLVPQKLKETKIGILFSEKINAASGTEIGKTFPSLYVQDTLGNSTQIIFQNRGAKYILIDFWFSHCVPCIVQFPKLKELYQQYNNKGFQIIGVSIDAKKDMEKWLIAIGKYKLPWEHFLDADNFEASRLSVSVFPTTFLLSSDGKIIARNLELSQLEEFLKNNLQ